MPRLTFASAGVGTSTHLAGEFFQTMAGIEIQHVPYRDSTALLSDLIAGRINRADPVTGAARSLKLQLSSSPSAWPPSASRAAPACPRSMTDGRR
ncbi:hypothetical protein IVA83_13315 [Bradyrhizobium sp. 143]|nr:hypothetical protein [Bradyrhizobium sp. 143]MCK1729895.1 hypothetical protein [Bradyrhizobium sp. 142]